MRRLTEETLIEMFTRRRRLPRQGPGVLIPSGDDAAAVKAGKGKALVLSTDHMAEGVHFERAWAPPFELGRKLFLTNLSDFAAMGAMPRWALLNAALPSSLPPSWAGALARGLHRELDAHRVALVGGDTTASRGTIFLSLTLLGEADAGRLLRRSGARAGDRLFVSGNLGGSAAGLRALRGGNLPADPWQAGKNFQAASRRVVRRHLVPPDRLSLGRALAARPAWRGACMDVSDGLAADLSRLCRASGVGAEIRASSLPVDADAKRLYPQAALELALYGGEDYELLFSAPPASVSKITALGRRLGAPLAEIGFITKARRLVLVESTGHRAPIRLEKSFRHF